MLGASVIGDHKECSIKDPLPAITIEDLNDTVAVKRAGNTLAVRESREKHQMRTEALLSQVKMLVEEVLLIMLSWSRMVSYITTGSDAPLEIDPWLRKESTSDSCLSGD